ncbi:hypothetical protein [Antarcticirhabdus aurantiaca]|uniref:Uncharacterized protein n=1 Tax=Antarcticirhabdus aurantiaca TaxID=2606717 RepID=A0ACD4NKI9_9HYPH|nr:hypothetical protein [Antarcticirhabdus aurantiaca]WAJ27400.1 hypothetical protein OXU80_21520 [Jeongeuplla avenae]
MSKDITRRTVLMGASSAALVGLTASASAMLAAVPSWMELRIEAHRETYRALERASELHGIHDEALKGSPSRFSDPELKAAWDVVCLACECNDVAFRALLSERPRNMEESELRARYLAEECEDGIDSHPDFPGLFLGSMTGREG